MDTYGSVTAACDVIDNTNGDVAVRVGLSFANPLDAKVYKAVRARGLAKSRLKGSNIVLPVTRDDKGKLQITEAVRKFLVEALTKENLEVALGVAEYNGRLAQLREWFPEFVKHSLT